MHRVPQQEATKLAKKLETIWDIKNHYWYPLYDCQRHDVIAFHDHYVKGIDSKMAQIQQFLIQQQRNQIYRMQEDRTISLLETVSLSFDKTLRNNEHFWFDLQFDWIIYHSHEGSITFGGNELITALKAEWHDWESYVFPVS